MQVDVFKKPPQRAVHSRNDALRRECLVGMELLSISAPIEPLNNQTRECTLKRRKDFIDSCLSHGGVK